MLYDEDDNDDVYSNSTFTEGTEGNSTVGTASLYGDDGYSNEDGDDDFYNNASLSNWLTDLWSEDIIELSAGIQPEQEIRANLTRIDTNNDGLGSYCIADLMKGKPKWKVPSNDNQLMVYWSEGDVSQGSGQ